jgi:hypothetical protein
MELAKTALGGMQLKVLIDFTPAALSRNIPREPKDVPPSAFINKEIGDIP